MPTGMFEYRRGCTSAAQTGPTPQTISNSAMQIGLMGRNVAELDDRYKRAASL